MTAPKAWVGKGKWRLVTGALGVLGLAVVAMTGFVALQESQTASSASELASAPETERAWGSNVLATIHHGVIDQAPIGIANACGLGATSCFKCHNKSERGPKPVMDKQSDPWHPQHMEVNHSCDGCHKGNPRLMVKNISHRGLVADPRTQPDKTCGGCHNKGEVSGLLKKYQGLGG
jgi:hypothetical protein